MKQERQTKEEKGIHELKRGIRKTGPIWLRKKESRREKLWSDVNTPIINNIEV